MMPVRPLVKEVRIKLENYGQKGTWEKKSDSCKCGMTAAPFNKDIAAFRITNDGYTIGTARNVLSILFEKPCLCAGYALR